MDLRKVSVPEAIKILYDKQASLFNEETRRFSKEIEKMILGLNEQTLIQYIKEYMEKNDDKQYSDEKIRKT